MLKASQNKNVFSWCSAS